MARQNGVMSLTDADCHRTLGGNDRNLYAKRLDPVQALSDAQAKIAQKVARGAVLSSHDVQHHRQQRRGSLQHTSESRLSESASLNRAIIKRTLSSGDLKLVAEKLRKGEEEQEKAGNRAIRSCLKPIEPCSVKSSAYFHTLSDSGSSFTDEDLPAKAALVKMDGKVTRRSSLSTAANGSSNQIEFDPKQINYDEPYPQAKALGGDGRTRRRSSMPLSTSLSSHIKTRHASVEVGASSACSGKNQRGYTFEPDEQAPQERRRMPRRSSMPSTSSCMPDKCNATSDVSFSSHITTRRTSGDGAASVHSCHDGRRGNSKSDLHPPQEHRRMPRRSSMPTSSSCGVNKKSSSTKEVSLSSHITGPRVNVHGDPSVSSGRSRRSSTAESEELLWESHHMPRYSSMPTTSSPAHHVHSIASESTMCATSDCGEKATSREVELKHREAGKRPRRSSMSSVTSDVRRVESKRLEAVHSTDHRRLPIDKLSPQDCVVELDHEETRRRMPRRSSMPNITSGGRSPSMSMFDTEPHYREGSRQDILGI